MGHYSNFMGDETISSEYPANKVREMFAEFKKEKARKEDEDIVVYLDIYDFEESVIPNETQENVYNVELVMEDDDYVAKHYADRLLAEFISLIIHPEHTHELRFADYETMWGYYIEKNKVLDIYYVAHVNINGESIPLSEIKNMSKK